MLRRARGDIDTLRTFDLRRVDCADELAADDPANTMGPLLPPSS